VADTGGISPVDSQVAQVAINKVRGHLWYISEDLIGLALFSDQVSVEEKATMVSALQKPKNETDVRRVDPKAVPCFQSVTLSDFVTKRSTNLFAALQMNTDFLASHPSQWPQCLLFCDSKEKAAAI